MNKDDLKISQAEFDKTKVSRLSDRPNVGYGYGGRALSAQELKERYDASAVLIREHFNALIDALAGVDENGERIPGVADLIMTGIAAGYSLGDLFSGLGDGSAMQKIKAGIDNYSVKGYMQYLATRLADKLEAARVDVAVEGLEHGQNPTVSWQMTGEGEDKRVLLTFAIPEGKEGEDGKDGTSGVYVGSGPMPEDCNIKIDPSEESEGGISDGAVAFGVNTMAGSWGFRITASSGTSGGKGTYTLEGYESGYDEGDTFSLCVYNAEDGNECIYDLRGTISAINGNEITVENFVAVKAVTDPNGDKNTLWVVDKPEVGIVDIGVCAVAMGHNTRAVGGYSRAGGADTQALGKYAHTEGVSTKAHYAAHAEGRFNEATGQSSHAEGFNTKATGDKAHSEGSNTTASGMSAHTEGNGTTASGARSHAEGENTHATEKAAHSEGNGTEAIAEGAHAEGITTHAKGKASHAEGKNSVANGEQSHAEGDKTSTGTSARGAHSEGINTSATGVAAHAEGYDTAAEAKMSHAAGEGTIARSARQYVCGMYNEIDEKGDYAFIVGNGKNDKERTNAFAVKWDGTLVAGGVAITPAQLTKLLASI